jgi:DNA-binding winged helix-turn-helix (wHTH) protein/Tfp pilus assembly protein PilF
MERSGNRCTFGPYTLDVTARMLKRGDASVPLNGKAFELLRIFAENPQRALSREELYERLWPGGDVEDGNLSQNVYLIRRALGEGNYVETIPRFGYRFCAEVCEAPPRGLTRAPAAAIRAAIAVLAFLTVALSASAGAPPRMPLSPSAREAYSLGIFHLRMRTPADLLYARGYFQSTVRDAPQQPLGYAALAQVYALLAEYYPDGSSEQRRALRFARAYRDDALARDPENSEALAAAGFIAYRFDGDALNAERLLHSAIASDPQDAAAYHWHGVLSLIEGRTSAALADLETAHRLEPASEIFVRWLARAYTYAGRPDDALALVTDAIRIEPGDEAALLVRACAQEERGDLQGALRTLHAVGARDPWELRFVVPDEARIEARLHRERQGALIARIDGQLARHDADPYEAALFYLTIGRKERGNTLLKIADSTLVTAGLQRNDPRYKAL